MSNESFHNNLPEAVLTIGKICREQDLPAYVIGGYVRDLILNRSSKDIDVVVIGDAIEVATKVAKAIGNTIPVSVFKNFGTAMIKLDDIEIEFVGARKESYSSDSRKPKVFTGTLEDDQNRRDFTINALAISLNKNDFGTLLDPFNGLADIDAKIIRTPLDPIITYSDDPLRMMRAIRFATQLQFTIEKDSLEAISTICERIKIISMERVSDELNKIGNRLIKNSDSPGLIENLLKTLHLK